MEEVLIVSDFVNSIKETFVETTTKLKLEKNERYNSILTRFESYISFLEILENYARKDFKNKRPRNLLKAISKKFVLGIEEDLKNKNEKNLFLRMERILDYPQAFFDELIDLSNEVQNITKNVFFDLIVLVNDFGKLRDLKLELLRIELIFKEVLHVNSVDFIDFLIKGIDEQKDFLKFRNSESLNQAYQDYLADKDLTLQNVKTSHLSDRKDEKIVEFNTEIFRDSESFLLFQFLAKEYAVKKTVTQFSQIFEWMQRNDNRIKNGTGVKYRNFVKSEFQIQGKFSRIAEPIYNEMTTLNDLYKRFNSNK